jgi:hypothetical protein
MRFLEQKTAHDTQRQRLAEAIYYRKLAEATVRRLRYMQSRRFLTANPDRLSMTLDEPRP